MFFHQDDDTPASSYTANKTVRETPGYIQAAQNEALKVALDNAGFGIQLCDVIQEPENSSSAEPVQERGGELEKPSQAQTEQPQVREPSASQIPEEVQVAPEPTPAPTVRTVQPPAVEEPIPVPAPVAQTAPGPDPAPAVQLETEKMPDDVPAPTEQTVPAADPAPTAEPVVEEPAPRRWRQVRLCRRNSRMQTSVRKLQRLTASSPRC